MLNSMSNTMSRVMSKTLASSMSNTMLNWIFCCQMACLGHTFRHGLGMLCDMTLGMFFGFTGFEQLKIGVTLWSNFCEWWVSSTVFFVQNFLDPKLKIIKFGGKWNPKRSDFINWTRSFDQKVAIIFHNHQNLRSFAIEISKVPKHWKFAQSIKKLKAAINDFELFLTEKADLLILAQFNNLNLKRK